MIPAVASVSPADTFEVMFGENWPILMDLVRTWAPVAIGAGLTLVAISWVVGAVSRGKPPALDEWNERDYKKAHGAGDRAYVESIDWTKVKRLRSEDDGMDEGERQAERREREMFG